MPDNQQAAIRVVFVAVSNWFRFKLWVAVKCMALATWILRARPKLAEKAGVDPFTDTELDKFHKEMLQHTGDTQH